MLISIITSNESFKWVTYITIFPSRFYYKVQYNGLKKHSVIQISNNYFFIALFADRKIILQNVIRYLFLSVAKDKILGWQQRHFVFFS